MNVHQKLMRARLILQGKKLAKSGHNKFAGYQYFELGDFLPTVQEIFADLGLCGTVSFSADLATLTVVDVEKPETSIVFTSPMGSANLKGCHEVQNIGAVETYQRRYLWVSAMEIVEHDALDATTGKEKPEKVQAGIKHSPTKGVLESLAKDRAEVVIATATYVQERFDADDIVAAHEAVYELQDDELVALSSLIPSHIRTAIRKYHEAQKAAA